MYVERKTVTNISSPRFQHLRVAGLKVKEKTGTRFLWHSLVYAMLPAYDELRVLHQGLAPSCLAGLISADFIVEITLPLAKKKKRSLKAGTHEAVSFFSFFFF